MRTLGVITISLLLFVAAGTGVVHAQSGTVTATVRPNPLEVVVSVPIPSSVIVGKWFDISANITNLGNQNISRTVATAHAQTEVAIKSPKKKIGNLAGGQTKTVTWRAKANRSDNFVIQVEASGNLAGEQISSSDSAIISAVNSLALFLLRLIPGV